MKVKGLKESKAMSFKREFYEGMGSAFDLHGRNHFNEYDTYPGPRSSLNQHWQNVGGYIGSSIDNFASDRNLSDPDFSKPDDVNGNKQPDPNSFNF